MNKAPNTPNIINRHNKDKYFKAQMKRVFEAFHKPKTMLMASKETGILRANICRYIAKWEKQNIIKRGLKKACKISKAKAFYFVSKPLNDPSNEE